ncbi:hypothetical protein BSL78_01057 [Apostichopus japonicus]|uniref:Zer-1-like protein n=1 Tax=Stichopus japonicus TaxID=307972 RepID=A0A2G8LP62_STIJA|nr:hypothetical protein BSL78_01057 [Apostichopus japonicus]
MQLPKLLALDVSGVVKNGDMKFLEPLQPRLTTLVLHNCIILESSLQSIYKVKTLRHLDISVAESSYAFQLTPNMLRLLIHNLPKLKYLDLSGNSLDTSDEEKKAELTENVPYFGPIDADFIEEGGGYVYEDEMVTYREETFSISKFLSNCRRTFKFLGLLHIDDEVVDTLPASKVANLSCETNILTALQMYRERKQFALVSMNAFFDTIRAVDCKQVVACVELCKSLGVNRILSETHSASLFHLSRNNYRMHFTDQTKQLIITALLDAIEKCRHLKNVTLLRNCGLALLNFDIPGDFYFEFERVVKNFLSVLKLKDSEGLLPRIYVYMCNSIVCHVEGDKKLLVGKLGLVECMLQLIKTGLEKRIYDEVMETAWSALWNVTDETPYNCKIFVSGDGMELFLSSLQAFPDKTDLLRNMMGLVGNVAEVPELRRQLSKHVGVFIKLLQNKSDGIEVSYNAAGTLSHIASDGPEHWIGGSVTRQDMLFHLEAAVDSWDINSQRNINYRSFQPILRLLDGNHSYQVHLWASWAIANLCSVSPDKYCELLQKENGAETLENLSRRRGIPEKVKTLIDTAIRIYRNHVK